MFKKLLLINNFYSNICKRHAGHSKWANIKHTKTLKDSQRGKLFSKLSQQIKVAIQEGGSTNPVNNLKLEQIIAQAKRQNMPVASIDNVINSTQKDKSQMKSFTFEIKGPGSCIIICEVYSPNIIKTKNDISTIMKKHACMYSDGAGKRLFDHKGTIETNVPSTLEGKSKDTIMEHATNHAIECEAEDVVLDEQDTTLKFYSDPQSFYIVQKRLEKLNYNIINAELDYVPNTLVSLNDTDLDMCSNFCEKLENMDEVVKVYDNIA